MTLTTYGLPGTIAPGYVWAQMQRGLGRACAGFEHPAQFRPTGASGRVVNLADGKAVASGVVVMSNATESVTLPAVVSGSQYFLVVINIHWNDDSGGYRSEIGYVAGTGNRSIPAYTDDSGNLVQIPICLARITAGNDTPTEIVDLRLISAQAGGVDQIYDDLALSIAARIGVQVHNVVTGMRRECVGTTGYVGDWQNISYPKARVNKLHANGIAVPSGVVANAGFAGRVNSVVRIPVGDQYPGSSAGSTIALVEVSLAATITSLCPLSTLTPGIGGMVPDTDIGTIIDPACRPTDNHVPVAFYYESISAGNVVGGGLITPGGQILVTSLADRRLVKSYMSADNNPPTLRMRAMYYVPGWNF